MKSFQLDQCSNHSAFREKCNKEARCIIRRLPPRLRDHDDDVVLLDLLSRDACLLTMDFNIVNDNNEHIPDENPGIIVVKAIPNRATVMAMIIDKFKKHFTVWNVTDWSKIYLEIDVRAVYISRLINGDIDTGGMTIDFCETDFEKRLQMAINRCRGGFIC